MTISQIRKNFPALNRKTNGKNLIYLDNACTVLKPKAVIEAISDYYTHYGVCGDNRSGHLLSQKVQDMLDGAREEARIFLNAKSASEIIWTKNASEGINIIASTFPFSKNKNEVILSTLEHHSNFLPFFEQTKKRGIKIKLISADKNGELDQQKIKQAISPQTALLAITRLSNVTGQLNILNETIETAHKNGAAVLADDAQYLSFHSEDVRESEVDFLVFSGHKLGGPTGIGVLYVREKWLEKLDNYNVGGGTVSKVKAENEEIDVEYLPAHSRFEAGIQNYAGIVGFKAALEFLQKIKTQENIGYMKNLSQWTIGQLAKIDEINFVANYEKNKPDSIISFYFKTKKYSLIDFNLYLNNELDKYFIAVRAGNHCAQPLYAGLGIKEAMRLSFFYYNKKEELSIFIQALKDYLKK